MVTKNKTRKAEIDMTFAEGMEKGREAIEAENQRQREELELAREEAEIAERARIETAERERREREKHEAEDAMVIGAVNRARREYDQRRIFGSTTDDTEVFIRVVGQKKAVQVTVQPKRRKRINYAGCAIMWATGMITGAGLTVIVSVIMGVL